MVFVSRYLQVISYDKDSSIIWHSIFGRPMLCTKWLADELKKKSIADDNRIDLVTLFDGNYMADDDAHQTILDLREAHILTYSMKLEAKDIELLHAKHNPMNKNKVRYLSLIMSEECNFRCKYCIHFANAMHQYNPEKCMSEEVARKSIDQYLEIAKKNGLESAYINFGGGEPLLNWKTIKPLILYIDSLRKVFDFPILMGINTNMSLMTKEIAETIVKYDVELAASLDGLKSGNDSVRLSKDLEGTYDKILNGFLLMEEAGRPLDGFAMTVTEDNFFNVKEELIDWAYAHNMKEVRIDIDVTGAIKIPLKFIVERLSVVRRYGACKGISVIGFWSRPAENLGLIPEVDDIGFCGGERGESICVAPSGQVFPCGYSNYELGDYSEILELYKNKPYSQLLQNREFSKLVHCKGCSILGFCHGGCLITQEVNHGQNSSKMLCELYREMTYEILRESAFG